MLKINNSNKCIQIAKSFVDNIEKKLYLSIEEKTNNVTSNLEKAFNTFSKLEVT